MYDKREFKLCENNFYHDLYTVIDKLKEVYSRLLHKIFCFVQINEIKFHIIIGITQL